MPGIQSQKALVTKGHSLGLVSERKHWTNNARTISLPGKEVSPTECKERWQKFIHPREPYRSPARAKGSTTDRDSKTAEKIRTNNPKPQLT